MCECSEATADWLPSVMALHKKDVEPNPTASVTTSVVSVGLVEITQIATNVLSDLLLYSACVLTIFIHNYYPLVILCYGHLDVHFLQNFITAVISHMLSVLLDIV